METVLDRRTRHKTFGACRGFRLGTAGEPPQAAPIYAESDPDLRRATADGPAGGPQSPPCAVPPTLVALDQGRCPNNRLFLHPSTRIVMSALSDRRFSRGLTGRTRGAAGAAKTATGRWPPSGTRGRRPTPTPTSHPAPFLIPLSAKQTHLNRILLWGCGGLAPAQYTSPTARTAPSIHHPPPATDPTSPPPARGCGRR